MKKRGMALLLVLSLSMGMFTACGGDKSTDGDGAAATTTTNSGSTSDKAIVVTGGDTSYTVSDTVLSSVASVDTGDLYVTESMMNTGIVRNGNVIRIASAMQKASNGETVNLAFIGGSTCEGLGASSADKSYVNLIVDWFKSTFPSATINYVNIGLRETNSYFDVYRLNDEVLTQTPDIVFLDTANEDSSATSEEGFESMVRLILGESYKPAIVTIITTDEDNKDDGDFQKSIAYKYDLPVVSYADAVETNISNGTWSWSDIGADDGINPNDAGHAFLAKLVTTFLTRVIEGMGSSSYSQFYVEDITNTATLCRYVSADTLFTSPNGVAYEQCEKVSFSDSTLPYTEALVPTDGEDMKITTTAACCGIVYYKSMDGTQGQYDLYVDDVFVETLDGDLSSVEDQEYNYVAFKEVVTGSTRDSHTITLKKSDDSTADGFTVLGLLVTK